ncbi:hypothetical protein Q3G72_018149 [Acer saccharum]|nr:hypothetical protein Q3G72_018149 [Acer saccharum]
MKKEVPASSEEEVMKAFGRYCPCGVLFLSRWSLLALEQLFVSFQVELRLSEVGRVSAESQVSQLEHAMLG